jgi:hypothetical protein
VRSRQEAHSRINGRHPRDCTLEAMLTPGVSRFMRRIQIVGCIRLLFAQSSPNYPANLAFDFYFDSCFFLDCGANILENERKCKCNYDLFSPFLDLRMADERRHPVDVMFGLLLGLFASLRQGLKPDAPSPNGAISRVVSEVKIYA